MLALLLAGPVLAAYAVAQVVTQYEDCEAFRAVRTAHMQLLDVGKLVHHTNFFASQGVWASDIGTAQGAAEMCAVLEVTFPEILPRLSSKMRTAMAR